MKTPFPLQDFVHISMVLGGSVHKARQKRYGHEKTVGT